MANSNIIDLGEISVPTLDDIYYIVGDPAGTPVDKNISGVRLGGLLTPQACQGRLTLESGVPVSTSEQSFIQTLYWTPCTPQGLATASGLVGFYDGTRYVLTSLGELSLDLTTADGGDPIDVLGIYDVFIDWNGGSPQLVLGPVWTDEVTRATALAQQGSLIVLTGNLDWRWVGTICGSTVGGTSDTAGGFTTQVGALRFVWNAYNRVARPCGWFDSTDAWTYATSTWRPTNGTGNNAVSVVTGVPQLIQQELKMTAQGTGGVAVNWAVGLAMDSITTPLTSGGVAFQEGFNGSGGAAGSSIFGVSAAYRGYVPQGYHYITGMEIALLNTVAFIGDDGGSCLSGVTGSWEC